MPGGNDHDYEVVDATGSRRNLLVTVFDRHCKLAQPGNPQRCAFVLAAKDQHKDLESFEVYRSVAHGVFKGEKKKLRWRCPPQVYKFIQEFDRLYRRGGLTLPKQGVSFEFTGFSRSNSLKFNRSEEGAKRRRLSAERNKNKRSRRSYKIADPLTLAGVRSRFGRHPRS